MHQHDIQNQIPTIPFRLNQKGMSLIEIMIVLGIIAGIMGFIVPKIKERMDKSKVEETKIILSRVAEQISMYYSDCGKYPQAIEALTKNTEECPNWGPEPYFKKIPQDSWKRDLIYSVEGGNFNLKSLGSDGREGGTGFAKDITLEELQK